MNLTISRRERQNTIDAGLVAEIHRALDRAQASPTCRAIVLRGEAGVFCAGMDFNEVAKPNLENARGAGEAFFGLLKRFTMIDRVVIAMVDGRATGGGVGLAAASDFVVATTRSQFGLPEALWGILPCCVAPFLIRRVGFQTAYSMALSTFPVTATEGERIRLVDEVSDTPDQVVRRLLGRLTKIEIQTLGDLKQYFTSMWFVSEQMESTVIQTFARVIESPTVRRNVANFVENQRFPWENRVSRPAARK